MRERAILFGALLCVGAILGAVPSLSRGAQEAGAQAGGARTLEDFEERQGPFTLAGQDFTAVLHYKRLPGRVDPDAQTLALLEIRDTSGTVQYSDTFGVALENGELTETCSADVEPLVGSNGWGLLISTGCLPSAPLSGGPWQVLGVLGRKLTPLGKPIVTEGELGAFVPGEITHMGEVTQTLPDMLNVRVWTGYFFVTYPVRVDWLAGKLSPGQRCMRQTGHGFEEGGCEWPVENVERAPQEDELTFVRLFAESNEDVGTPAHVVVKKDSKVEILAGKVRILWQEWPEAIGLVPGDDVWVKIRVDGKEGWIHTAEDLNAIGLQQSG